MLLGLLSLIVCFSLASCFETFVDQLLCEVEMEKDP